MAIWEKIRRGLFLTVILVAGAWLRFFKLGSLLFWEDDPVHQVRMAYQPLSFVIAHNNQTSLSTLLTHFLLSFGNIQFMARLGSAVCGVLVILLVFVLGKKLFSRTEGLMAAAFVSVSPYLIQFSQYSRAYALFVLLAILSFYFFWLAWRENQWRHWTFWALGTALAIYNHLVALLILPAYMIFMGLVWLESRFGKADLSERPGMNSRFKRFALVTAGVIALDVLLYWPNADIRGSLADFFHKTVTRPEWSSAGPGLIAYILRFHIAVPAVRFVTVILAAAGLASSWKRHRREMILAILFMAIPYLLFILSHPTPSNTLSADRFFLFLLPLFLILAARGLVAVSGLLSSFLARSGAGPSPNRGTALAWVLAAMLAGGYFAGLRAYYLNFWRLSSWRVEPKVARYLEQKVKSDALIYFDFFPLSSLNMVVNPLTQDLKLEEAEFIIRKHLHPRPGRNDLLFYSLGLQEFRAFVAGRDVELWAVAKLNSEARRALLQAVQNQPQLEVGMLDEYAVLCLRQSGTSAARKLSRMADLFLSLPLDDAARIRHLHLLAAKAALLNSLAEEGLRQLAAYGQVRPSFPGHGGFYRGLAERALDPIFGLSADELIARHDERILFEVRRLLFRLGNRFMAEGGPAQALQAYLECLRWGADMNDQVLEKFGPLLDQLRSRGLLPEATDLCESALGLDPRRDDFRFALAGLYWQMGNERRAEDVYKKIFGLDSLSRQAVQELTLTPEAVIIWSQDEVWRLLFKSDKACVFSGKIWAGRKIRGVETANFGGSDVLKGSSSRVFFLASINGGLTKSVRLAVAGGTGLTFDIRINGRRDAQKVIILPAGRPGIRIPFTLGWQLAPS